MKYYLYVSDTKVDMLFDQLSPRLRDKVATELKIDLKFLSTTFAEEPMEKNRYRKLEIVSKYIQKNELVGTIDSPDVYFKGELPMHWGPLPKHPKIPGAIRNMVSLKQSEGEGEPDTGLFHRKN
jgi:hypothetical protein